MRSRRQTPSLSKGRWGMAKSHSPEREPGDGLRWSDEVEGGREGNFSTWNYLSFHGEFARNINSSKGFDRLTGSIEAYPLRLFRSRSGGSGPTRDLDGCPRRAAPVRD